MTAFLFPQSAFIDPTFLLQFACLDASSGWYTRFFLRLRGTSRCLMAMRPSTKVGVLPSSAASAWQVLPAPRTRSPAGILAHQRKAVMCQRLMMRQMTRHLARRHCQSGPVSVDPPLPQKGSWQGGRSALRVSRKEREGKPEPLISLSWLFFAFAAPLRETLYAATPCK
jgi:hypothetical protein